MNNKFYFVIPWLVCLIISVVALLLNFSYKAKNFDKVLESVITFGSIILGFLGALLGIIITIKNSDIMQEIHKKEQDKLLKSYFSESLSFGFAVIIFSIILQLLLDEDLVFASCIFFLWMFSLFVFLFSSYRIVSLLMKILFKADIQTDLNEKVHDPVQKKHSDSIPSKRRGDKVNAASTAVYEIEKKTD